MEEQKKKKFDQFIDNLFDIFYSKDRTKLYVVLILLLGFGLRLINIFNNPIGIDASGHTVMAMNFINSHKLGDWGQTVGLWDFLTDGAYKIFGVNDFSSRLIALIFGTLSILVIFLFAKELFNKKVGLISAFLLAVSAFHIKETAPEMDVAMMFFVLLSMLFFIRGLKQNKKSFFVLSGIFIGVGVLMKLYAILFVPVFIFYGFYVTHKDKNNKKRLLKYLILFLLIISLFCLIPIVSNYLLYKDKGIMSFIFTKTLGIGEEKGAQYYSWDAGWNNEREIKQFFLGGESKHTSDGLPLSIVALKFFIYADILLFFLGLIGIILLFKRKDKNYLILLFLIFVIVFFYLATTKLQDKHYLFLVIMFIPLAALFIEKISQRVNLKILIVLILIFQIIWLSSNFVSHGYFLEKSGVSKLVSYKNKNVEDNSLVIFDSRIFRGIGTYVFLDKHYLESSYLQELLNIQKNSPGEYQPTRVYFIECVPDDCGWGTIKDQPEFNESMENIVKFFKNNSKIDTIIYDKKLNLLPWNHKKTEEFKVYKNEILLKPSAFSTVDSTHTFFLYPVGYDEQIIQIFDNYQTHNQFDGALDNLAHGIFYLAVFFAIISIIIVFYLFIIENEDKLPIN